MSGSVVGGEGVWWKQHLSGSVPFFFLQSELLSEGQEECPTDLLSQVDHYGFC